MPEQATEQTALVVMLVSLAGVMTSQLFQQFALLVMEAGWQLHLDRELVVAAPVVVPDCTQTDAPSSSFALEMPRSFFTMKPWPS